MITNWTYTDVPQGIDLTIPLMPHRDARDMTIYGVDVAWQNEVLSAWAKMSNAAYVEKVEMPTGPAATFTNGIRNLAADIKSENVKFYKTIPTDAFVTDPSIQADPFGDVPAYVSRGDPVRRADVADVFAWMDVGARYRMVDAGLTQAFTVPPMQNLQYQEYGTEASSASIPESSTQNTFYEWAWGYESHRHYDENNNPYWTEGGKFRERKSPDFSVSLRIDGLKSHWFSAVHTFARVGAYAQLPDGGQSAWQTAYFYLPIGSSTVAQDGDGIAWTSTFPADAAISAARTTGGLPSPVAYGDAAYIHDITERWKSGSYLWAAYVIHFRCYLELSPDYRV